MGVEHWDDVLSTFDSREEAVAELKRIASCARPREHQRIAWEGDDYFQEERFHDGNWGYAYCSYWIAVEEERAKMLAERVAAATPRQEEEGRP